MRIRALLLATCFGAGSALPGALLSGSALAQSAALSGQVSSAEEGTMEGVLVSAKKEGSTITTTVVIERQGPVQLPGRQARARQIHHHHPRRRLRARRAEVAWTSPRQGRQGRHQARQGRRTSISQLSNAEWLISVPGDDQQQVVPARLRGLPHAAAHLHRRRTRADEWKQVFTRMGRYAPESMPTHPQLIVPGGARSERRASPPT